ncbi:MAG: CDP-alcohol phosphatidyltransferase family protein, partial [Caldilineaceae bacterium]
NRLLDGLDGVVARIHGKQSDFGGYLDLLLDYVVYLAIPVAFVWATPTAPHIWSLISLLVSYQINSLSWTLLSSLLEKQQLIGGKRLTSIEMPAGLIEGAETVIFYTLFFLLPAYIPWLFGLMAGLVVVTACQRIWWARRNLE